MSDLRMFRIRTALGVYAALLYAPAVLCVTPAAAQTIDQAVYDANTHRLQVTGSGFVANPAGADVDVSKITLRGTTTHTLSTTSDVEIDSSTYFEIQVMGSDTSLLYSVFDQLGTVSSNATTYNLEAADDWLTGVDAAQNITDLLNPVTVTISPQISNAVYDPATGVLVVTCSNLEASGGSDIDASAFTITGAGGGQRTLGDTADVERDSVNQFTLTLGSNDRAAVNALLDRAGMAAADGTAYNLAAVDDWCGCPSSAAGNIADASNAITVSGTVPNVDLDADDSSGATGGGYSGTFADTGGAVAVADSDSSVTDDGTLKSLTVTLTNRPDGAREGLSSSFGTGAQTVNAEAVTIAAYDAGSGVLAITVDDGSTAAATIEALIESIRYDNGAATPDTATRTITFVVTDDADHAGATVAANVMVTASNEPPELIGLDGAPSFTEHGAAVFLDENVVVTDPELDEAGSYDGASLTLAREGGADSSDVFVAGGALSPLTQGSGFDLGAATLGTVTTNDGGTLTLTFGAGASAADVDAVLQSIQYRNDSHVPPTSAVITWVFDDGNTGAQGSGGALTASGSITVSINPVNDSPTGEAQIAGTVAVGETLTADTSNLVDDDGLGAFSYQWQVDGEDVGTDSDSYVVAAADVGKTIRVSVSYTDGQGTAESTLSGTTGAVPDPCAGVDCTDDDECTTDACMPGVGCVHMPASECDEDGGVVAIDGGAGVDGGGGLAGDGDAADMPLDGGSDAGSDGGRAGGGGCDCHVARPSDATGAAFIVLALLAVRRRSRRERHWR